MFKSTMTANTEEPEKSAAEIRQGILKMMMTFEPAPPPIERIIESDIAVKRVEDWSACRSPSRAKRRHKMGHRQHVVIKDEPCFLIVGGITYCHPDLMRSLDEKFKEWAATTNSRYSLMDAFRGKL